MKKIISLLLSCFMLLSAISLVSYANEDEEWTLPFTDLKEGAWYMEGIEFCYNNGIVQGMNETTFAPNGTLTRAQFVQILAMYDRVDLSLYNGLNCGFSDVKSSHWYNNAVCWAYANGYVSGVSRTRFAPNDPITREQFARILYIYAESYEEDVTARADLTVYDDESKVSSWAYEQVEWAVAVGIISGTSETTLSPRNHATRAQACRMIMSFDSLMYPEYIQDDEFFALVDYVYANGVQSEENYDLIEIVEVKDDQTLVMSYDMYNELITFEYYMGEYQYVDAAGDLVLDYQRYGTIQMYDISSSYSVTAYIADTSDTNYYYKESEINKRCEKVFYDEGYGLSEEYITSNCEAMYAELNAFAMKHILSAGVALEDVMDRYVIENTEPEFITMVEYIKSKGSSADDIVYELVYNIDGQDVIVSYDYFWDCIEVIYTKNSINEQESVSFSMPFMYDSYSIYYECYSDMSENYISTIRTITENSEDELYYDYNGYDEADVVSREAVASAIIKNVLNDFLSDCGLDMSDIFIEY